MNEKSNKTAVDWLIDQMLKQGYFDGNKPLSFTNLDHLQHQAKEMEKQQIIDANYDGQRLHAKSVTNLMLQDNAESYYNETYGSKGSDDTKTN